jgi:phosphoribosyl-ATP pyrophosphohydrolase
VSGTTLYDLEAVLRDRRAAAPAGSYSATLLRDPERAGRKVAEEAVEVLLELTRPEVDAGRLASEAADLLFHLLAGLVGAGVPLDDVLAELDRRREAGARSASGASAGPGATGSGGAA